MRLSVAGPIFARTGQGRGAFFFFPSLSFSFSLSVARPSVPGLAGKGTSDSETVEGAVERAEESEREEAGRGESGQASQASSADAVGVDLETRESVFWWRAVDGDFLTVAGVLAAGTESSQNNAGSARSGGCWVVGGCCVRRVGDPLVPAVCCLGRVGCFGVEVIVAEPREDVGRRLALLRTPLNVCTLVLPFNPPLPPPTPPPPPPPLVNDWPCAGT